MRDSVPSGSYSSVCNVLRQWSLLIESTDSMISMVEPRARDLHSEHPWGGKREVSNVWASKALLIRGVFQYY